ncbi:MAG: hypothetical protein PV358_12665 [Acidimicrobiales bacterium]|nr:hypothetical protein [Acidimicrobiales bacterium]
MTDDTGDSFVSVGDTMDRDDGTVDWDAAFEAIVSTLRPARHVRVAAVAWRLMLAVVFVGISCWMFLRTVVEPLNNLGRPWV